MGAFTLRPSVVDEAKKHKERITIRTAGCIRIKGR
jgi:hypothetical protein